jgi:hypothetical protein
MTPARSASAMQDLIRSKLTMQKPEDVNISLKSYHSSHNVPKNR